jgi:hypothetical protein
MERRRTVTIANVEDLDPTSGPSEDSSPLKTEYEDSDSSTEHINRMKSSLHNTGITNRNSSLGGFESPNVKYEEVKLNKTTPFKNDRVTSVARVSTLSIL